MPYSRRLAEAEGRSHDHSLAVLDEYKLFAFLAQAAGHPVTPSVAVDAAWHFHLQCTLEYLDVFCAACCARYCTTCLARVRRTRPPCTRSAIATLGPGARKGLVRVERR
ncbi:hypothetical protein AB3X94_07675 [Paraburkholderia sp. BR10923]|uniref:hypothetical protein n=1 Tax=Paraburkholderia sp. BR10923 TaxID=3236992 RepID=UPI0034CDF909